MFQGALQSRDETVVIDDPEASPTVEEVVMQVSLDDGLWHRLTPNHQKTACGEDFNITHVAFRPEKLQGAMCLKCFTDYERLVAADLAAKERAEIENMQTPSQWLDRQEVLAAARIDRNRKKRK